MTTMAEPEWDDATRDLALAYDDVPMCPACGGPAYLCQDPATEGQWDVLPAVRCHKHTAVREKQAAVTHATNPYPEALLWKAVLKEADGGR